MKKIFFSNAPIFFLHLRESKRNKMVAEEYYWAITEAATLQSIIFQCAGVWISNELQRHTSEHIKGLVG